MQEYKRIEELKKLLFDRNTSKSGKKLIARKLYDLEYPICPRCKKNHISSCTRPSEQVRYLYCMDCFFAFAEEGTEAEEYGEITTKEASIITGLSVERIRQAIYNQNLGRKIGRCHLLTMREVKKILARKGKSGKALEQVDIEEGWNRR